MSRRPTARGQAITEATLAILVFITVLVAGIHFAEVTVTQMKVTEAAQAGVWDSTAGEMHAMPRLGGTFNTVNGNVANAGNQARMRYADFEGRQFSTGSAAPKGLFSSAVPGSMNIQCRVGVGLDQAASNLLLRPYELLVYDDNDGMRCSGEARINPFGVMRVAAGLNDMNFFAKSAGAAKASQTGSVNYTGGYRTCAVGRFGSGGCRGNFDMLIDDWGLASGSALGGSEDSTCTVLPYGLPCAGFNMPFWTSANLMYQLSSLIWGTQNNADRRLVQLVGNPPVWAWPGIPYLPGNPTSFYLSFMGEDTGFIQLIIAGDASFPIWFTTPFGLYFPTYVFGWTNADDIYLGKQNSNAMGPGGSNPISNP